MLSNGFGKSILILNYNIKNKLSQIINMLSASELYQYKNATTQHKNATNHFTILFLNKIIFLLITESMNIIYNHKGKEVYLCLIHEGYLFTKERDV